MLPLLITSYPTANSHPLDVTSPAFSHLVPTPNSATSTCLSMIKSEMFLLYISRSIDNAPLSNSTPKFVSAFSSHFKSGFAALAKAVAPPAEPPPA